MTKKLTETAVPDDIIMNQIYLIRGQKVMIDKDLAELYGVQTKRLKESVKRNQIRFPDDFMFELSKEEFDDLRSHFASSSWGGARYLPMAFTEQGVAMLSSVLNSDRAIMVNIQIIRIFTRLRQAALDGAELRLAVEQLRAETENNTQNIELIFQHLDGLLNKEDEPRRQIGYK